jgi:hypothetical protein
MKSALAQIGTKIDELIASHAQDLESAWANIGEGSLAINFPVKIGINKNGKQLCEVGISFVVEKCQDSESFEWDDRQPNFFPKKK